MFDSILVEVDRVIISINCIMAAEALILCSQNSNCQDTDCEIVGVLPSLRMN